MPSNMGFKLNEEAQMGAGTGLWGLSGHRRGGYLPAAPRNGVTELEAEDYSHDESGFVEWKSIPNRGWGCEEWIEYFKALKRTTGKRNANTNFVKAWRYFGNVGESSGCSGETDFYEYFKKQGIDISSGQLEKFWSEVKLGAESGWGTFKTIITIAMILIVLLIVGVVFGVVRQLPAVVGAASSAKRLR